MGQWKRFESVEQGLDAFDVGSRCVWRMSAVASVSFERRPGWEKGGGGGGGGVWGGGWEGDGGGASLHCRSMEERLQVGPEHVKGMRFGVWWACPLLGISGKGRGE